MSHSKGTIVYTGAKSMKKWNGVRCYQNAFVTHY